MSLDFLLILGLQSVVILYLLTVTVVCFQVYVTYYNIYIFTGTYVSLIWFKSSFSPNDRLSCLNSIYPSLPIWLFLYHHHVYYLASRSEVKSAKKNGN